MSALLSHAKAYRALGECLSDAASDATLEKGSRETIVALSVAHIEAAYNLEEQAKAEATGNPDG